MSVVTILVGEAHHFAIDALRFTQRILRLLCCSKIESELLDDLHIKNHGVIIIE